jgi:Type I phosphodiesterase / nucleotide pyrophosphatase
VRQDALGLARTPHLDAVVERGVFSSFVVGDQTPVNSGPLWATVVLGVWPRRHGVYDNTLASNRLHLYPDFLHALAEADPQVRTYVASGWPPLVRMFRSPHRLMAPCGDRLGFDVTDETVARDAAEVLSRDEVDAAFVHLAEPDCVAHDHGVGPAYIASIERTDARLGRIVAAVDGRCDERWTIVVVTDHGHLDEGGHGGRSSAETGAWVAACGPRVVRAAAAHVDIFPTAFAALGMRPPAGVRATGTPLQGEHARC